MNKEDLQSLIRDTVKDQVQDQVKSALEETVNSKDTGGIPTVLTEKKSPDPAKPKDPKDLGIGAARMVRALANSNNDPDRAKHFCDKLYDDPLGEKVSKALSATSFDGAGFLIPPEFAEEIIELLRSRNVVRRAGPRTMPMPMGSMTINRQDSSASASYQGENEGPNASEPSGGQITMSYKKLVGLVPLSNDLIQFAQGDEADRFVREDLVQVLRTREDKAFLRDDGSQNQPKGLRHWASNVTNSNYSGSNKLSNIQADVATVTNNMRSNDVPMDNLAWFMSAREMNELQFNVTDSDGRLMFQDQISNGQWMGFPVFATTNIPTDLNSGSDSEIYLANMNDVIIGEAQDMRIAVSSEASYNDSSGTTQSAFQRDQTIMRAIMKHDLAVRHNESVEVLDQVDYSQ